MSDNQKNVKIQIDVTGNADRKLKGLGEESKKVKSSLGNTNSALIKTASLYLAVGVAVAKMGGAVADSIEVGKKYQATMSKVKAISGATEKEFNALAKSSRDLGKSTSFTANQVGELQVEYSKLGFTADEINNATEATLNLAKATGEDLATSAGVAGGVVRAFGLIAEDTTLVTDVMAKSFTTSALDLQKFKVAIGQSGKVASDAGLSLAETSSILGTLANQNIRAETAGVGMKNILLKINEQGESH